MRELSGDTRNIYQISASDFHEVGHLASGGVVLDRPVKTSAELKDALLDKGIVEL